MRTVSGVWVFNDLPIISSTIQTDINFVSNGYNFYRLNVIRDSGMLQYLSYLSYDTMDGLHCFNNSDDEGIWKNIGYKTIDFGATPQTVSNEFYTWLTANATQQSTNISIDLTTLTGWSSLATGSHNITVKAKADGYADSNASNAVSVTKAASEETWVFKDGGIFGEMSVTPGITANIEFTSNSQTYTQLSTTFSMENGECVNYNNTMVYIGMASYWINQAYRTVTFATAPTGDLLAWLQANAVKQ